MFDKITAEREKLRRLHSGDPQWSALDALFGAIQEALDETANRINQLNGIAAALTEKVADLCESLDAQGETAGGLSGVPKQRKH